MNRLRRLAPVLLAFIIVVGTWQFLCAILKLPEYLLPSPLRILRASGEHFYSLCRDAAVTIFEAACGFIVANVLSLLIAIGFCHAPWLERSFYPYIVALKAVPIVAVSPLLVLWFGYGYSGKIVMAAVVAFFPLVVNATRGLKAPDRQALDLMATLSASRMQILVKLRLPVALPYIVAALKISAPMAVLGAIVAEMTGARAGLGATIMIASMQLDTPLLFAAVGGSALVGVLFFWLVMLLDALMRWFTPFSAGGVENND